MRGLGWNSTRLALDLAPGIEKEPGPFWPLSLEAKQTGQLTESIKNLVIETYLASRSIAEIVLPAWTLRACVEPPAASDTSPAAAGATPTTPLPPGTSGSIQFRTSHQALAGPYRQLAAALSMVHAAVRALQEVPESGAAVVAPQGATYEGSSVFGGDQGSSGASRSLLEDCTCGVTSSEGVLTSVVAAAAAESESASSGGDPGELAGRIARSLLGLQLASPSWPVGVLRAVDDMGRIESRAARRAAAACCSMPVEFDRVSRAFVG